MIALALLGAVALFADGELHVRRVELELVGPLADVRLVAGERGATLLHAQLIAGERRTVVVPLAGALDDDLPRLREEPESAGDARCIRWVDEEPARAAHAKLNASLRARPRPRAVLGSGASRVPWPALLVVAAFAALAPALRRKLALLLGASVGVAVIVVFRTGADMEPARSIRVLEGAGSAWVAVDSARDALALDVARPLLLELEPEHAHATGELSLADLPDGRWTLRAPGAGLLAWSALDPLPRMLDAELNRWGSLAPCWTRSADGRWSSHGRWDVGAPLGAALGDSDPPGWLNPALPQGTRVVIGRLAPGSFAGAGPAPAELWLRWIGP